MLFFFSFRIRRIFILIGNITIFGCLDIHGCGISFGFLMMIVGCWACQACFVLSLCRGFGLMANSRWGIGGRFW